MKTLYATIILTLAMTAPSHGTEFCANSYAGIRAALILAQSNNQHNIIKVVEGNYTSNGNQLNYSESAGWDLEISGGWTEFFGNPCGQQLSGNPFNTVLNGDGASRIMNIESSGNSDITISNFTFFNGGTPTTSVGGGLRFWSTNSAAHTGKATIERNVFIGNQAESSSAIAFFSSGPRSHIRNNIFTLNSTTDGTYTITIDQDTNSAVYFTNNTLVDNAGDEFDDEGGLSLFTTSSSSAYIGNNVLYDNGDRDLHISGSGDVYLHYNDVGIRTGSAPFSSVGNISADPAFNTGVLEFSPSFESPLVNAGFDPPNIVPIPTPFNLAWFEGTLDVLGNVRKQQGKVEMGAIEIGQEPPIFFNGFE